MNNRLSNRSFVGGPKVHFGDVDGANIEHDDFEAGGGGTALGYGNFERHDTPHPKPSVNSANAAGGRLTKKSSIDGHVIPRLDDVRNYLEIYNIKQIF